MNTSKANAAKAVIEECRKQGITLEDLFENLLEDSEESSKEEERNLTLRVSEVLKQFGIPAHIKGYRYIRYAIEWAVREPDILEMVTKILYPGVAKAFKTTPSRVERAIRHAIEISWIRGDIEVVNSYFGYTIDNNRGKPTNSEFIAMLADSLRLEA